MVEVYQGAKKFFTQTLEQALARHGLEMSDEAQNYLSRMLEQFAVKFESQSNLLEPTLQYQLIVDQTQKLQRQSSRQLGDHCLFLVGYFYEFVAQQGSGWVRYHADIGANAYQQAGREPCPELAQKFTDLYVIIGDLHLPHIDEKRVIEIYEKWLQTGDRYYESLLLGKGIIPQRIKADKN